ncbi:DNA-binding protein [Halomonas piscis]|uniref:DNA-binding protein n=1 Tax=Halomonas piscis TaxID=3031727 RepID=UPI0028983C24|nr:DNA-binding protein [Halomonas piscis]
MALTPEKIHAAADQIAEAGERPTLARVRKALGGGSFSTISEAMQAWREKQTEEHALAEIEVPEPINERVEQLKAAAWEAAVAEAERRLSAERAALDEAQAQATGEVEEAREAVQTLEEEAAERDRELETMCGKLAEAERGWREAEQQREAESARLSERLSGLEARLNDAQTVIDRLTEREADPSAPQKDSKKKPR